MALPFVFLFFFFLSPSSTAKQSMGRRTHSDPATPSPSTELSSLPPESPPSVSSASALPSLPATTSAFVTTTSRAEQWCGSPTETSPLGDAYGNLTLEIDGNLVAYSSSGSKIWSSNTAAASRGIAEAVLLDFGNLVLRLAAGDQDRFIWQSFDHPTNTLLPETRLTSYLRPGIASPTRCVSWRAEDDPSLGSFTLGIDLRTTMKGFICRRSEPYWRSNLRCAPGLEINSTRITTANGTNAYVHSVSVHGDRVSWWFTDTQGSAVSRVVILESGFSQLLSCNASSGSWVIEGSVPDIPSKPCEFYNQCGSNGVSDGSQPTTRSCKCLKGFVPRNFGQGERVA